MTHPEEKQMSETFRVGALLAVAGGFLDAFTYLCHGGVFANAQTGNIVLLGIRLAEGNLWGMAHYLLPIAAFVAGILLAEGGRRACRAWQWIHWRQPLLLLEAMVLICCAFAPAGVADAAVNVAVSFVCALQVQGFRKVHGHALATTMCTGNLRSAVEALLAWRSEHSPEALRRSRHTFGVVLFFILGAALGVFCVRALPGEEGNALWVPVFLLATVFILLFRRPFRK